MASGQPLTLTGLASNRNARSAPQTTSVSLLFNQSLNTSAATLGAYRVALVDGDLAHSPIILAAEPMWRAYRVHRFFF